MWRTFHDAMAKLGDKLTEKTGWAAVRVPLERAARERQVTLDIPGYLQTNSYSCGAISAMMVARFFHPGLAFGTVYDAIDPDPDLGAGATRVKRGLRACGISVAPIRRLRFADFCEAIDRGCPVMASIHNPGARGCHWVVVYGYGKRPDQVFVAGNNLPWIGKNPITRHRFEGLWDPKGNGLVCSRAKVRRPASRSRTSVGRK